MSFTTVPVCASCRTYSRVSISCTKCFQNCCPACFDKLVKAAVKTDIDLALLAGRICRKCKDKEKHGEGPPDSADQETATGTSAETAQELCPLHGKVCKLFCVNCSECICGACIDLGEQHDLHRVDSLPVVYRAKTSEVLAKLAQVEKLNSGLNAETTAYRTNLELLEKEEDIVVAEIEAVVQSSKLEVARLTTARKEILNEKLSVPIVNEFALKDLRSKVEQLSINDFLQQAPEINKKCDELIARQNAIAYQRTDDIYCDLIPSYQFKRIVYPGFSNAENDNVHVASLQTTYGFEWKFTLSKLSNQIRVQSTPSDPKISQFRHLLVVIIPHPDYSKRVHRVFDLEQPHNTFDAVDAAILIAQGFGNANGDLVIMVGVRPLNVVIEKRLLSYQLVSKTDKFDYDHLIMHFKPKLSKLQSNESLHSLQVKDEEDRNWRLEVTLQSGIVAAYVQLVEGSAARASYFIELQHINPVKTIVKKSTSSRQFAESGDWWGFSKFITWDKLSTNEGFYTGGRLHFRFGVRPIQDKCQLPAPCAANA